MTKMEKAARSRTSKTKSVANTANRTAMKPRTSVRATAARPAAALEAQARTKPAAKPMARKKVAKPVARKAVTRKAPARKAPARKAPARNGSAPMTRRTAAASLSANARRQIAARTRALPAAPKPQELVSWREEMDISVMPVHAGTVRIRKMVSEEKVSKTIKLQRQQAMVTREKIKPAEASRMKPPRSFGKGRAEQISCELQMQQAVISMRMVPVERVKLAVRTNEETVKIADKIRREDFRIEGMQPARRPETVRRIMH